MIDIDNKEINFNYEPIDIVSARIEVITGKFGYHESFSPIYSPDITIKDDLFIRKKTDQYTHNSRNNNRENIL